jgi:hypothetical protein
MRHTGVLLEKTRYDRSTMSVNLDVLDGLGDFQWRNAGKAALTARCFPDQTVLNLQSEYCA